MEWIYEKNRIYTQDTTGKLLAEVTFPNVMENVVNINHTYVAPALRGQGVAGELLQKVTDQLRQNGWKAYPTCTYAVTWFEKHGEEYADLLTDDEV